MGSHLIVFSRDPEADRAFFATSSDNRMSMRAMAG